MRWIFFSLALFNLIAFAWGMAASSKGDQTAESSKKLREPYAGFPQVRLLSEQESSSGRSLGASRIERIEAAGLLKGNSSKARIMPLEHAGRLLCELVGPFESNKVAADFVQHLLTIEISSTIKAIELPAGRGYWVYLEPVSSRRAALRKLGELQAKQIDSYVIPKGELANGISLGMFSKKSLSDTRVNEMRSIGLYPKVDEIERSYRELWVMLDPGEGMKMSDLSWERAMEGLNMLERRQNYCLDVAS